MWRSALVSLKQLKRRRVCPFIILTIADVSFDRARRYQCQCQYEPREPDEPRELIN